MFGGGEVGNVCGDYGGIDGLVLGGGTQIKCIYQRNGGWDIKKMKIRVLYL